MSEHDFNSITEAKNFADIQRLNGLKAEVRVKAFSEESITYTVVVWEAADA